ncbi:MAG: anhydro-N-acetylmuramic acid kinase [Magnetovibrionaceae bacterium]
MTDSESLWALGLMSGTSLDGMDAALVRTDGLVVEEVGFAASQPYPEDFRARLRKALGPSAVAMDAQTKTELARDLADHHAELCEVVLRESGIKPDVVGFHGQTLFHAPDPDRQPGKGVTVQIGDGQHLADRLGIDVVGDFRTQDVSAGGEGAPFAPLYHWARAAKLDRPLGVLNLGGVGNVTCIGKDDSLIAFDTGPGNALLDDWILSKTGNRYDAEGALSGLGRVDGHRLMALMTNDYFLRKPPKSIDRDDFSAEIVEDLNVADGAATLAAFTVASVARSRDFLGEAPALWLVTGGGRHNKTIMQGLVEALGVPVEPVESAGWRGDYLEAEAFGFLAVRHLRGLPTSLPETTAVPEPVVGGVLFRA